MVVSTQFSVTRSWWRVPFGLLAVSWLLVATVACSDDDENGNNGGSPTALAVEKLTFVAGFKHQANLPFVGAYVAKEKGFFEEEGLAVEIRDVATPGDNFKFLAANEAQFTTADAQTLLERRAGDPALDIVSVALIGQEGQQGFAVLTESGIQTPADWEGKTAGYKGSQVTPDYLAILASQGVKRENVNEVKVGFAPQVLTEGQVDIFPVFISNEPDTLRKLGFETRVFEAADYGAPTLGLTYAAMGDYAEKNPDIVARFVRAALKGIAYADENREEAIDIVLKYAPMADPAHEMFTMDTELDAAKGGAAEAGGIGAQTEEQWQRLHDYLVRYGALSGPLDDVSAAFTTEFLDQP
jgi:ABC-type nitrate/sulfonate/bicarbonate transport system substrate-binding protein